MSKNVPLIKLSLPNDVLEAWNSLAAGESRSFNKICNNKGIVVTIEKGAACTKFNVKEIDDNDPIHVATRCKPVVEDDDSQCVEPPTCSSRSTSKSDISSPAEPIMKRSSRIAERIYRNQLSGSMKAVVVLKPLKVARKTADGRMVEDDPKIDTPVLIFKKPPSKTSQPSRKSATTSTVYKCCPSKYVSFSEPPDDNIADSDHLRGIIDETIGSSEPQRCDNDDDTDISDTQVIYSNQPNSQRCLLCEKVVPCNGNNMLEFESHLKKVHAVTFIEHHVVVANKTGIKLTRKRLEILRETSKMRIAKSWRYCEVCEEHVDSLKDLLVHVIRCHFDRKNFSDVVRHVQLMMIAADNVDTSDVDAVSIHPLPTCSDIPPANDAQHSSDATLTGNTAPAGDVSLPRDIEQFSDVQLSMDTTPSCNSPPLSDAPLPMDTPPSTDTIQTPIEHIKPATIPSETSAKNTPQTCTVCQADFSCHQHIKQHIMTFHKLSWSEYCQLQASADSEQKRRTISALQFQG